MSHIKIGVSFILASGSPRRKRMLETTGFKFRVVPADVDESVLPGESGMEMVDRLARVKALTVSKLHPDSLVLGADTSVELDGALLAKPESKAEAHEMLMSLSGKTHLVHTGIALAQQTTHRVVSHVETTSVHFAKLSEDEIERYIQTGSPMDKAGAYGIQDDWGAFFVRSIDGDFFNVMGLPLHQLYQTLKTVFPDLLVYPPLDIIHS